MGREERNTQPSVSTESGSRRGRPPGEVSPETLLRQELIAHLRLYKRSREIVERRLEEPGIDAEELTKYMDLLRKGIADMVKPFVAAARPEQAKSTEEAEDGQAILDRLLEGKN